MIIVYEQNMLIDDEQIVPILHKNDHMPYIKYKDPKGGPSWILMRREQLMVM
jgi:hypothetical protein